MSGLGSGCVKTHFQEFLTHYFLRSRLSKAISETTVRTIMRIVVSIVGATIWIMNLLVCLRIRD